MKENDLKKKETTLSWVNCTHQEVSPFKNDCIRHMCTQIVAETLWYSDLYCRQSWSSECTLLGWDDYQIFSITSTVPLYPPAGDGSPFMKRLRLVVSLMIHRVFYILHSPKLAYNLPGGLLKKKWILQPQCFRCASFREGRRSKI